MRTAQERMAIVGGADSDDSDQDIELKKNLTPNSKPKIDNEIYFLAKISLKIFLRQKS